MKNIFLWAGVSVGFLCLIALSVYRVGLFAPDQSVLVKDAGLFSNDKYRISFLAERVHELPRAKSANVVSVLSDGKFMRLEPKVNVKRYMSEKQRGVVGNMVYVGDSRSPDGDSQIVMTEPFPFGSARFSVRVNGRLKRLLWGDFGELQWLPDNRRIVFTRILREKTFIEVIDTRTGKYARLARGQGFFLIKARRAR